MIDANKLQTAFDQVAKEELAKKIHEWIIYTAPPEILKLYHTYLKLTEDNDASRI